MNIPEGGKFIFFVIPVFAVTLILLLIFFNNKEQLGVQKEVLDSLKPVENEDDIFTDENGEILDFDEFNVETLEEGNGKGAEVGDEVSVHYRGTLTDGTQFDSSYDRGEPYTFTLGIGAVIEGWDQGILGMKVGEKRLLEIPSSLGYGEQGTGSIPGEAGLIFETELVSIN